MLTTFPDSDRDGRAGMGNTHSTHTTGSGLTGNHGTHNTHGEYAGLSGNNHGPISGTTGVVGGTADQHRQTVGAHAAPGVGQTGSNYGSTNAGPHNSNVANKIDPRVGKLFLKPSTPKLYSNNTVQTPTVMDAPEWETPTVPTQLAPA